MDTLAVPYTLYDRAYCNRVKTLLTRTQLLIAEAHAIRYGEQPANNGNTRTATASRAATIHETCTVIQICDKITNRIYTELHKISACTYTGWQIAITAILSAQPRTEIECTQKDVCEYIGTHTPSYQQLEDVKARNPTNTPFSATVSAMLFQAPRTDTRNPTPLYPYYKIHKDTHELLELAKSIKQNTDCIITSEIRSAINRIGLKMQYRCIKRDDDHTESTPDSIATSIIAHIMIHSIWKTIDDVPPNAIDRHKVVALLECF
jgi:hypothetical protein